VWDYVHVKCDELVVEQLSVAEYLEFKKTVEPFNASFSAPLVVEFNF
jgi:hypothetical protein